MIKKSIKWQTHKLKCTSRTIKSMEVIVVLYCNYHILVNEFFKVHIFATLRRCLLLNCNCNKPLYKKCAIAVKCYLLIIK